MGWFDKVFGSKAKDIELPNETMRVDPRLPQSTADKMAREGAGRRLRDVAAQRDAILNSLGK